jgi:hypothetical protein
VSAAVRRELTLAERDFLLEARFAVLGTTNENDSAHLTENLTRDPRAGADIRKLALRYYQSEERVQRSVNATWARQHRVTYRMPVQHVYSSGF